MGLCSFGEVYLVHKSGGVDDGTLYAMKYRTERGLLQKGLEAPFLVGVYYEFQTQRKLCLVQEYYAGGDLLDVLREWGGVFSVDETRLYLAEIIEAVEYLHKLRVIHRDLKLQNIFVDAEGHIAVADYGLCKDFAWTKKEVDWWSVGVMAFEMMIGRTPFQSHEDKSDEALFLNILYRNPDIPLSFSDFESDFMRRMLEKDPRVRLGGGKGGVDEMKEHPFFDGINWDDVSRRKLVMPHALDSEWEDLVDFEVVLENEVSFLRPGDEGGNINEACSYIAPVLMRNGSY
ncbi:ribosomal protein S6 kinase alpha-4-like [Zootermopsis nevadensis]|uniref:ribosomal protein S6 kinase alpha-4-like n=1 Tax=Zootermopsis nevadensis TaxID=136037 RepID=UPI000B8EC513|nr:ribosomal protein S6 kinase alpha-4-like [Zootermopsis nevadensis]